MLLLIICSIAVFLAGSLCSGTLSSSLPLVSHQFTRAQCLNNQFIADIDKPQLGFLKSVQSVPGCIYSDGVSSSGKLTSVNNGMKLKKLLGATDYTIELWVKPVLNLSSEAIILSIGKDSTTSNTCANNLVVR